MRVHGVDFSGAQDAGDHLWVASAEYDGQRLRVDSLRSATTAFGRDRAAAHENLRAFIAGCESGAAVGLDCSFGLPRQLHDRDTYPGFLEWFAATFDDPTELQEVCAERATRRTGGERTYLKRATDEHRGAQSPYHWLVAAQTFYGIRDVVAPLAMGEAVSVDPIHPHEDRPHLCEVYPAATLRALSLPDEKYKDASRHPDAPDRRRRIVHGLEKWGVDVDSDTRETLYQTEGGDPLDAVVAAVAAGRAALAEFAVEEKVAFDPVEGYIYV